MKLLIPFLLVVLTVVGSGCALSPSESLQVRLQNKYERMKADQEEERKCAEIRAYYKNLGVEDK